MDVRLIFIHTCMYCAQKGTFISVFVQWIYSIYPYISLKLLDISIYMESRHDRQSDKKFLRSGVLCCSNPQFQLLALLFE
jgi:hypothetical protein